MAQYSQSASDAKTMTLVTAKILKEMDYKQYFSKFTSEKADNMVWKKMDMTKTQGDKVTFSFDALDDSEPKGINDSLQNNSIKPTYYTHTVTLSLIKDSILYDNEMTPQRSPFNIDAEMQSKISSKMARDIDRLHFQALSTDITRVVYNNAGTPTQTTTEATAITAMDATYKLTPELISWTKTWAMTGGARTQPPIEPIMVNGRPHYILLVHPDVMYDFKRNAEYRQYLREAEIRGPENPIFSGATAIVDGVVIHEHERVSNFTTGGAGGAVAYSKCHFLGKNALCQAWGNFQGQGHTGRMFIAPFLSEFEESAGYYYKAMIEVDKPVRNSLDFGSLGLYVARTQISDS